MALSIGIVGLPNVGKSTLFNALTQAQNAQAANYPFCTIEPNKASVPVPDNRLDKLVELVKPQKTIHAAVDFIDIAGLVRGASKGQGLGNQFLANIRECSVILEVVRCFADDNITHVDGSVDPLRDIETIETELILADIDSVERRLERLKKQAKSDKDTRIVAEEIIRLLEHLNSGQTAASFENTVNEYATNYIKELHLLSEKTVIYCVNTDEDSLTQGNGYIRAVHEYVSGKKADMIVICARLEEELQALPESEQTEMLSSYGIKESGLKQVISKGYASLGLISYFTAGEKEARAWTIRKGFKAPQAAGVIHTDFERGFIRAEIISYDDYIRLGSESACRNAGLLRVEGKDYIMQDGDIAHFLFNVG